jgi:hypothetical protein
VFPLILVMISPDFLIQMKSQNLSGAIAFYQKAFDIATCRCDQQHALAGKKAAQEAQNLINRYGLESKPTQYFWGRLQELTQSLPCVQIQQ